METPESVVQLNLIGRETVETLTNLAGLLESLNYEDERVLTCLNRVMEQIKEFRRQADAVKQANSTYLRSQHQPVESVQIGYQELLEKIQGALSAIEMENTALLRKRNMLLGLKKVQVEQILKCAKPMALTVHAPPGWDQVSPLMPYRPPYPTEDLIRSSVLFSKMSGAPDGNVPFDETSVEQVDEEHAIIVKDQIEHDNVIEDEDAELLKGLDIASL